MKTVQLEELGRQDYKEVWDYQEELFDELMQRKLENRELPDDQQSPLQHYLLLCEHPHVITLGRNGEQENLLMDENFLQEKGIDFYKINRGGDITYHGPGQIVGYPIFDLEDFFTDIHKFLRYIEEAIIRTLYEYDIKGERLEGATGVWLDSDSPAKARKICAIGIRCSRWITMHGWAFNVNTDLNYFDYIVPCGINDKAVTSMQKELGHEVETEEVRQKLKKHLQVLFNMKLEAKEPAFS